MSLDLSYSAEQVALQASIATLCERAGLNAPAGAAEAPSAALPEELWAGLAEIGVLGLGTEHVGGGMLEIAAAMETLGSFGAPGPLVGTFAAGALLGAEEMMSFAAGEALVSVGDGSMFPWSQHAACFVELGPVEAWQVAPVEITAVDTTAGEPWGRVVATRSRSLGPAGPAAARAEVAIAAYLVGAGHKLLEDTSEYARQRRQFGKPIATFQAVSHPLAQVSTRLTASRVLCRGAAQHLDDGAASACTAAATARVSAVGSATTIAYLAHQVYGAIGFTLEGPVARLSHRIRQIGMLAPRLADSRQRVLAGLPSARRGNAPGTEPDRPILPDVPPSVADQRSTP